MYCEYYIGVSCVDGSCPVALAEQYEEYDTNITSCKECYKYKGCEDCGLKGKECPLKGDKNNEHKH